MSASYFYVRLSAQALRRGVSDVRRGKLRFEPFACAKGKCAPLPFLFEKNTASFVARAKANRDKYSRPVHRYCSLRENKMRWQSID